MTPRSKRFKLSCSFNKSKLSKTAATPGLDLIPGVKSCSVQLTDLLSDTIAKVGKLESEVNDLRAFKTQYEPMVNDLRALTYLIGAPEKPDLIVATGASKLLSTIASEVTRRIRNGKNAIVFNVSDKTDLNFVRCKLLNACGLNPYAVECLRLRKKQQKYSCPLLFKFPSEADANMFISRQPLLQKIPQFSHIRVIRDRTPLERAFAMKSASALLSETPRAGVNIRKSLPDHAAGQMASPGIAGTSQLTSPHLQHNSTKSPACKLKPSRLTPVDLDQSPNTVATPTKMPLKLLPSAQPSKCKTTTPKSSPTSLSPRSYKRLTPNSSRSVNLSSPRPLARTFGASRNAAQYAHHPASHTIPEPLRYTPAGGSACNLAASQTALHTYPNVAPPLPLLYGPVAPSVNFQNPILPSGPNSGFFHGACIPYPPPMTTEPLPHINREHALQSAHYRPIYTHLTHQLYTSPTRAPVPCTYANPSPTMALR